jgi:hypothetical protein
MQEKKRFPLSAGILGYTIIIFLIVVPAPALSGGPVRLTDDDNDGIWDLREDNLMNRFAPVVYLHPDERYKPAGVDWYLTRVELVYDNEVLLTLGNVTVSALVSQEKDGKYSGEGTDVTKFRLQHTGDYSFQAWTRDGYFSYADQVNIKSPCYVHVRPVQDHPELIDIQYWFFYPYNGPTESSAGLNHAEYEGDWEHITVRVRDSDESVIQVHFARHSQGWCKWYDPSDVTFIDETHPVVYSALHSHASYTDAGDFSRYWPLTNDQTSDGGSVWDTRGKCYNMGEHDAPNPGMEWIRYTGKWGRDSHVWYPPYTFHAPETPALKEVWTDDPPDPVNHHQEVPDVNY